MKRKLGTALNNLYKKKDQWWLLTGSIIFLLLWVWDRLFLNAPALRFLQIGFLNTLIISTLVILISLILAWVIIQKMFFFRGRNWAWAELLLTFFLNLIRSIPQIVGVLLGYVLITILLQLSILTASWQTLLLMAAIIALFVFLELVDLMQERITFYQSLDFYNAMKVCGISSFRIINFNILWKNSRGHILNKLIALFGVSIFLQCSVDFIISVGLSTKVSALNLPVTLGSLLAKIDSKQDILAIGYSFSHPARLSRLFLQHLQGISVAFSIVFLLIMIYKISNGYAERHRL